MSIFHKFIKENKGVGIIEYVILLSLLGTVIVTTTPVLREQVGQMYEEQTNSTNHLNGMIDTENAERYDLDSTVPYERPPNDSITNPGGITDTELSPIILEKKNITYNFVTTNSEEIADTYFYDDGQFDGVLFKTTAPTTQRILATRNVQLEKEVTKVIQGTEEELTAQDTIEETDEEGYTGTLIATGDVEKYITGTSPDSYIETKEITTTSPMISSIETTNSNVAEVTLEYFPDEKYFEELQPGGDSLTGYKGTLSRYGSPVRTQEGTIQITDVKPANQNRTFSKAVDVTDSTTDKTYKYISGQGFTSTNSTTYPANYHYKDAIKEGLLNYVSKSSTLIDTKIDEKTVSVSPESSSQLPSTYNYNVSGYVGTLSAIGDSYPISGQYTPSEQMYVTAQTNSYYDVNGFKGNLTSYIYDQYYVDSQSKNVTGQTSSNYSDASGYSGTLSEYQSGGSPESTINISKSDGSPYSTWQYVCDGGYWAYKGGGGSNTPSSLPYNSGGYVGTYYLDGITWDSEFPPTGGGCSVEGATRSGRIDGTAYYSGTATKPDSRTYLYSGTVVKPGYYQNTYRYQGDVVKAATDNRVWSRDYSGNVTKTTNTYEYFANYSGKIFDLVDPEPSPAPISIVYTDPDGYSGTLYKDVGSEIYSLISLTSSSKPATITGYKVYTLGDFTSSTNTQTYAAIYNYNSEGYTGNLNYVNKGTEYSHTAPGPGVSKTMVKVIYGDSYEAFPETYNFNEGGYSGTIGALSAPTETSTGCAYCTADNVISGTINGNWERSYKGIVRTVGADVDYYKHYGTYSGTVSKPIYLANFNYNADYDGEISKDISVPNYRYDQKYIGTLEKSNIVFEYGYERMYEGTIFKNVVEQDIEYTQEYEGEVTRK